MRAAIRDSAKGEMWAQQGCEVALARMEDPDALRRAFSGAEAVFVLLPPNFDPSPGFTETRQEFSLFAKWAYRVRFVVPARLAMASIVKSFNMPLNCPEFVRTLFAAFQTCSRRKDIPGNLSADDQPRLTFAVIGDWGRQGSPDQRQVARQMGIACERAKATFVVSVGDNFYERGVTSLDDSHWQQSFEMVYDAPSLQVPWYITLGNHDYAGRCEPQLEYGKTHPRWIIPARYYSQVHQLTPAMELECFFLDTCPFVNEYQNHPEFSDLSVQDPDKQLEWLNSSLSASKAEWRLVFGHHPAYSSGLAHGNQPEIIQHILPVLKKHHVQAYFAGHDHDLEHLKLDHLDLIISGAGSEHRPVKSPATSPFSLACSGFVTASVGENDMHVRFFNGEGRNVYSAKVSGAVKQRRHP